MEVAEIAEQSGECGYDCTDRERELHRERMNRRLQAAGRYHVQEIISPPPPPPPAQPIRPREKPAARVAKASVAKPEAGLRPWQQRRYDPGDFASRSTPRWAEQPERRWVGVAEERWANATTPLRM